MQIRTELADDVIAQLLPTRHVENPVASCHRALQLRVQRGCSLPFTIEIEQACPSECEHAVMLEELELTTQCVLCKPIGSTGACLQIFMQRARLHAVLKAGATDDQRWQSGLDQTFQESIVVREFMLVMQ